MVEPFEFPKEAITQSFLYITFLPEAQTAESELFEIGKKILSSYDISVRDIPYSFSKIFIKHWHEHLFQPEKLQEFINEMLIMAEAATFSKKIIRQYFCLVKENLYSFFTNSISLERKNEFIATLTESLLKSCNYLSQISDQILAKHHRLVFEDNYAISLVYMCLTETSQSLLDLKVDDTSKIERIINYFSILLNYGLNELFKYENPNHIKVFLRTWVLRDLKLIKDVVYNTTIFSTIKELPPVLINIDKFSLFKSIIDSPVILQAINTFLVDTLSKENCPFNDENEGRAMIRNAFAWVMESGNAFFADLMSCGHGYSTDGYVFIDYSYVMGNDLCKAFLVLSLLHECLHIYKRIGDNRDRYIESPVNSFILFLDNSEKAEDGSRFENILIPNKGLYLYLSGAIFIGKADNWNMTLEMFNEKFNKAQEKGREGNEPFMKFSYKSQSMDWPKCIRFQNFFSKI